MARHLRLEFEGAICHVTSRGNERSDIFAGAGDRDRFVEKLAESVERHHVRLYAYTVMTNHYHLLLETPRANLSAFLQQLNTSYTMYYNIRHQRVGHAFSGRPKARVVEGDPYLLKLTRYVHLNPVKAGAMTAKSASERIRHLRAYEWSSYPAYAGLRKKPAWLDCAPLEALAGKGSQYRGYVESGLAEDDDEFQGILKQSSKAVGTREFCRWVEGELKRLHGEQGSEVDVAMRRVEVGADPAEVMARVGKTCRVDRESLTRRRSLGDARLLAVLLLEDLTGLTQRGVARELGLKDGSGLGRLMKKADERLNSNREFRRCHAALRKALSVNH